LFAIEFDKGVREGGRDDHIFKRENCGGAAQIVVRLNPFGQLAYKTQIGCGNITVQLALRVSRRKRQNNDYGDESSPDQPLLFEMGH